MLKDSFYTVSSIVHQDSTITCSLEFNSDHAIFGGHFPGQPVVPGACMLQMVKELLNETLGSNYYLKKADSLKFMAPIDPRMADDAEFTLSYKTVDVGLQVNAALMVNGVLCFKMKGVYIYL